MNDSHFLQATQPAELIGQHLEQQRHFHRNLPMQLPDLDVWENYRNPKVEHGRSNTQNDFAEAMTTLAFWEQPAVQSAQRTKDASHSFSLASTESKNAKKNDGTSMVVFAFEVAAAGLLVRLGLKHLAKNGAAKVVGEAQEAIKGVGAKLQAPPRTLTPSSLSDLPNSGAGLFHTHPLPRIRTTEREGGPLRVG